MRITTRRYYGKNGQYRGKTTYTTTGDYHAPKGKQWHPKTFGGKLVQWGLVLLVMFILYAIDAH